MDIEGMEGGNGVVMEAAREDGMWSLGGRLISMLMTVGILVAGVVVVAVRIVDLFGIFNCESINHSYLVAVYTINTEHTLFLCS